MRIPWNELKLITSDAIRVGPGEPGPLKDLRYFKEHKAWPKKRATSPLKNGYPWEDPANPWTWGPRGPDDVDWEGFPEKEGK